LPRSLYVVCAIILSLCVSTAATIPALGSATTKRQLPGPFDATNLQQPTQLAGTWLVQAGDDPAYAGPNFDDSSWLPYRPGTDSLHDLYPRRVPQVMWYRLHLKVSPNQTGLALQEFFISSAFQIFVNGNEVLHIGQINPFIPGDYHARLLARIPDAQIATGSIVLALRVRIAPIEWSSAFPGYYPTNLILGQENVLEEYRWLAVLGQNALSGMSACMAVFLSLAALLLFTEQRQQREYLWLFLLGIAGTLTVPLNFYSQFHTFPARWHILDALVDLVTPYLITEMYFAFLRKPFDWRWKVYVAIACPLYAYSNFLRSLGTITIEQGLLPSLPALLLTTVLLPLVLVVHFRRGNREAGILLVPLLLTSLYEYLSLGSRLLVSIAGIRSHAWSVYQFTERFYIGQIGISMQVLLNILSMLALALILLLRSNRMSRQRGLLETEVAAAREVQQVILPENVESIPGFQIESVYEPAQQVGGDFFQVLPTGNGGLLLVVGDVAGKGLPAAMLVSVLVGAIRATADFTQEPAALLASLNERLLGRSRGGFSTALAAHISADGQVNLANAGHLSPYLDGREIEIPGALPLGITSSIIYESIQFELAPGNRLTFYSDGVIEAQDQSGELFGFQRGQEISTQSAAKIVEAAKRFGQSDDITVVAITRTSVAGQFQGDLTNRLLSENPAQA
jgi:sigma-B regulation protein RsbU (phosphoserine phosphatase)